MDEDERIERTDRRARVLIDGVVQERMTADLKGRLIQDTMPAIFFIGIVGFMSLLALISFFRDLAAWGLTWMAGVSILLCASILIRAIINLRTSPRKIVARFYPIGFLADAGVDDGYLRQSTALGSARTVLNVYDKLALTTDSVMLKQSASIMIVPRRAFAEEDVRALEAHFATKNGS